MLLLAFHTFTQRITNLVYRLEVCGSTRTRGYGSGTGTKSMGTGIPVFTRKERYFYDVGAISNVFLFLPFKNITYDKS